MIDENEKKQSSQLSVFKVLRAVLIGGAIFWGLTVIPRMLNRPDPNAARPIPYGMTAEEGADWLAVQDEMAKAEEGLPPKVKQGNWGGGKTSAQCHEEVNTYWHAVRQRALAKGDNAAADSISNYSWKDDSYNCHAYDGTRIMEALVEPRKRLAALKDSVHAGAALTAADRAALAADVQALAGFPENGHSNSYYDAVDQFLAGVSEAPVTRPARPAPATCGEIQSTLAVIVDAGEMISTIDDRYRRANTDGPERTALNKRRVVNSERFTEHAKAARDMNCTFPISRRSGRGA